MRLHWINLYIQPPCLIIWDNLFFVVIFSFYPFARSPLQLKKCSSVRVHLLLYSRKILADFFSRVLQNSLWRQIFYTLSIHLPFLGSCEGCFGNAFPQKCLKNYFFLIVHFVLGNPSTLKKLRDLINIFESFRCFFLRRLSFSVSVSAEFSEIPIIHEKNKNFVLF